jgi:3-oxoacyl-[acyl-carrier protein] reductase
MNLWLRHKRPCITCATGAIGLAIADAFASEGCDVALCGPEVKRTEAAVAALRQKDVRAIGEPLSMRDAGAVRLGIDRISAAQGGIDIIVLNVVINGEDGSDAIAIDLGEMRAVIEAAIPHLAESMQGSIVAISPPSSYFDTSDGMLEAASRAAMTQYMRILAVKLIADGLLVNVMSLGDIVEPDDDFYRLRTADPELYSVLSNNPMRRRATPGEIVSVAVFMASPAASFVTGANWNVDGGSTAHREM